MARLGRGIELVGRRAELATLTGALARAAAGRPAAVLLSGDAGVGKSRLLGELVEHAGQLGYPVLVGRCLDAAESALPYLPFTEIIGALAVERPELVAARPALRHLLPDHRPRPEPANEDRRLGQVRVFDAVLSALDELASSVPLLVAVEDVHWADRSSRDLLVFLMSRLSTQRLLLLASYRSDDLHRGHPLRPVLAELARLPTAQRVELGPLDPASTLELVDRLSDGKLPERSVRLVARRSEGNAFLAEELVSAGAEGMPHELAELLMARIDGLPGPTRQVLRISSAAGRRVQHDQLAAVSGLAADELEQALRDAVEHRVLVAERGPAEGYAFRHALLREAVYHDLLPGERSRIHGRFAALLAGSAAGAPGRSGELAHHALAAHDLPLALAASVRAAGEADEREAPAELLVHAERALELWPVVPDAPAVAGVDEVTVTRWAAWGASATGDPDRGIALGRRALDLAEGSGDPELSSFLGRLYALRLLDLVGREPEAHAAARRAVTLLADRPATGELAWAHAVLARVLGRLDRFAEATTEGEAARAVAAARPPEDLTAAAAGADALVTLAVCAEFGGQPERARHQLADAVTLARRAGNLGVELRAHYALGLSLLDAGRLRAAGDRLAEGARRAEATGTTWSGYGLDLRVALVIARFMAGEWDAAETAAELAGEAVSATVAARVAAAGLLTAVGRGRFDAVGRRLAELREVSSTAADDQVIVLAGQSAAESALWQGRPDEAQRQVQDALAGLETVAAAGSAPHLGGIMLAALGVTAVADLAATGRMPAAAAARAGDALLEVAERAAAQGLPRGGSLGPEGRAWLAMARAERTRIEVPDPDAWGAVLAAFAYEVPEPAAGTEPPTGGYRQAYARWRRAEARLARGAPRNSIQDDLCAALRTAGQLGAAPLAAAGRALAQRAGVRTGDQATARSGGSPTGLTPRELSVLHLVAGGRTNRQVGSELYISEKTVSVHLSRVMAKLGAGSRTEAVSLAYARGLLTPGNE